MGALTNIQVQNLLKAASAVSQADGDGLTFTLSAKGTAAWVLRYRTAGAKYQREITLGRYPDISLAEARKLATEKRAKVQQGADVAKDKQKEKFAAAKAWTVRRLADDYLQKLDGRLAEATIKARRQQLRDYVMPSIGNVAARDVGPSDLVDIVERASKTSLHVARLVLVVLRDVFRHGIARHVIASDPSANVRANSIVGPRPVNRTRIMLTEAELRVMLPALEKIGTENALMVKILLATGARIGELVNAEWSHIDFEKRTWTIPAINIKGKSLRARNGEDVKDFVVPLTNQVLGWFLELKTLALGSGFVLPIRSRKKAIGDTHMEPVTLNAAINVLCAGALKDKCRRFTPHDLRSTARSYLGALGVDLIIAERCLNHSLGGLIAVYDQHDYLSERRKALELWSAFLQKCEMGGQWNVISLKQAAA
jgi:integrase